MISKPVVALPRPQPDSMAQLEDRLSPLRDPHFFDGSPASSAFTTRHNYKSRVRLNSLNSAADDDEESVSTLKPDGGWGWVVVLASFAIQIIADGVANAHGIIFVELLQVFGETKGKTAWVGSVFSAVPLLAGPIASALAEQYGCRPITILGAILSAFGFGLSVFATSIEALCVTLGLIAGFGLSLVYVTSMFILVRWFDNRLSFTMGISSAGSGIGMFIFAPFVTYLLETYLLEGTFLILAGVFLNIVVFGAVMREPEEMGLGGASRSCNVSDSDDDSDGDSKSTFDADDLHNMRRCVSMIEIPTYYRQVSVETPPHMVTTGSTDNMLSPKQSTHQQATSNNTPGPSALKNTASPSIHPLLPVERRKRVRFDKPPPPVQRRIVDRRRSYLFGQHHVVNWKRYGFHVPLKLAAMESLSCPDLTSEVDLSQEEDTEEGGKLRFLLKPLRRELRQIRRLLFNVKPLRSVKFCLFCVANLILYLVVDVPCDFGTDNATTQGIDFQKASFLLSIIGIVTTIGQPIYGWLGDRTWCNSLVLFAASTLVCGILTGFVPFFVTYEALAAYSALFGFFISGSNPLFAVILVDIVDEKYFSSAFGLLYFAQGIATLFGPPLAGYLYDQTDNYDVTFYTASAGMILASLMLLLFPVVKNFMRRRRRRIQLNLNEITVIPPHSEQNGHLDIAESGLFRVERGIDDSDTIHNTSDLLLIASTRIPDLDALPAANTEHRARVGTHFLPPGETPPVHVGTHLLPPIQEDD